MNSGSAVLQNIAINSGTVVTTKSIIAGSMTTGAIMKNMPTERVQSVSEGRG